MYVNPVLFAQVTNREDWDPTLGIYDDLTGLPIDLTGFTFQLEIRRIGPWREGSGLGYGEYQQSGTLDNCAPLITASLGNGLTVIDTGIIQIEITEAQMRKLESGTYGVYMTANDGTKQKQLFVGRLPIFYGGVTN